MTEYSDICMSANRATHDYWLFDKCSVCGLPKPFYGFNWNGHGFNCKYARAIQKLHNQFGRNLEEIIKDTLNVLLEDSGVQITELKIYDRVLSAKEIAEIVEIKKIK